MNTKTFRFSVRRIQPEREAVSSDRSNRVVSASSENVSEDGEPCRTSQTAATFESRAWCRMGKKKKKSDQAARARWKRDQGGGGGSVWLLGYAAGAKNGYDL